jgi:hypothetical protein
MDVRQDLKNGDFTFLNVFCGFGLSVTVSD